MASKAIVSFADESGNYLKALTRLEQSLKDVNFDGLFFGYTSFDEIHSPPHKGENSVPYAFKAWAINEAIKSDADLILWCDSVCYATKDLTPIFEHIEKHGYLFLDNIGFSIGDYTSDACLKHWGMSRSESFHTKMIMGCFMGFDLRNEKSKQFLNAYINAAQDGISYHGDWFNNYLQVSLDMRCKGHRHDQSVASIIVHELGLDITRGQDTYFAYTSHKGLVPVSDSVCMWSEGI